MKSTPDIEAFEEIYRLHHKRVYSICFRMLRNASDAEDLTQEVFIQLFRKLHTFRGDSSFTTWLHRMTVNQVLMHFRHRVVKTEKTTEDGSTPIRIVTDQRIRAAWHSSYCPEPGATGLSNGIYPARSGRI